MKSIPSTLAPLQLSNYVVTNYSYKINFSAKQPPKDRHDAGEADVDFTVKGHASDPNRFLVIMNIALNKKPAQFKKSRYQISMELLGEFQVRAGLNEEQKHKLIFNNGSAILYGIARGVVAQFTGGCGTDRFLLPAVNLLSLFASKIRKSKVSRKTPPRSH